jgi:hypothetical protein
MLFDSACRRASAPREGSAEDGIGDLLGNEQAAKVSIKPPAEARRVEVKAKGSLRIVYRQCEA